MAHTTASIFCCLLLVLIAVGCDEGQQQPDPQAQVVRDTLVIPAPPTPDSTLVMLFAGDCTFAAHYERDAGEQPGMAFEEDSLLRQADVAMVNFEGPVTVRGKARTKPYTFRVKPSFLEALTSGGIDIVNLANNHVCDYGLEGLDDTIAALDSMGVLHVGAGRNVEEARRPVILERKGWRVGFLGFYGGGEAFAPTKKTGGVAVRDLGLIRGAIRDLRERDSVQYVVVNLHWGDEKVDTPSAAQRAFAHAVVNAGADAVIGHHPHVWQKVEEYRGGVIAYSIGNFIFGGTGRSTFLTGVVSITLKPRTAPAWAVIPVQLQRWRVRRVPAARADSALAVLFKKSSLQRTSRPITKE